MVTRQANLLGQMRLDAPHIRAMESSVAADFDTLAGQMMSGKQALVLKGMNVITTGAIGAQAALLQLNVPDALIMHYGATEAGTIFWVPSTRAIEVLNNVNPRLQGSFTASQTNYIGLDMSRTADASTTDNVQFLDAGTLGETGKSVPLARTLDYRIVISTSSFSSQPTILPIAKVVTDTLNNVVSIQDARHMMFRLASGGDFPDIQGAYTWPGTRSENTSGDVFTGGDKVLDSLKTWMDAAMTRMWDIGGGEYWYSATADRNVNMVWVGATFTNGENFEWDGTNLHWKGLRFLFDNSTGYYNDVSNQTGDSAGLTNLADGDCIYVDLDRTQNATGLLAAKAVLTNLGSSAVPGARQVIAWRVGSVVYSRFWRYPVGTTFIPATTTSTGVLKISRDYAGAVVGGLSALNSPVAISDRGGTITCVAGTNHTGLTITADGNGSGITATAGSGPGRGGDFTGSSSGSFGAQGKGNAATNGGGLWGLGAGTGTGVLAWSGLGATGDAMQAVTRSTDGNGLVATGKGGGSGVVGNMNTTAFTLAHAGVYGQGSVTVSIGNTGVLAIGGNGPSSGGLGTFSIGGDATAGNTNGGTGIAGNGGNRSGSGVDGTGGDFYGGGSTNGVGAYGRGSGSGIGLIGIATGTGIGIDGIGGTDNYGGRFTGGGTNGSGLKATAQGFGIGVEAISLGSGGWAVSGTAGTNGAGGVFIGGNGVQATANGASAAALVADRGVGGSQLAIDAIGDIQVVATRNYKYTTAVTRTLDIHPSECATDGNTVIGFTDSYIQGTSAGAVTYRISTKVRIPAGAILQTPVVFLVRNLSTTPVTVCRLDAQQVTYTGVNGSIGTVVAVATNQNANIAASSGYAWQARTITPTAAPADGWLQINLQITQIDNFVEFYGFRVTYTQTNVVPV